MMRPAIARPRPSSPVFLIWLSARWPQMMPTMKPTPETSPMSEATSDTIASVLVFPAAGWPYAAGGWPYAAGSGALYDGAAGGTGGTPEPGCSGRFGSVTVWVPLDAVVSRGRHDGGRARTPRGLAASGLSI